MDKVTSKPKSVPIHLLIYNAMNDHRRALKDMLSLIEKVKGEGLKEEEERKVPVLSLMEFLKMGEEQMQKMTVTLREQTAALKEILF